MIRFGAEMNLSMRLMTENMTLTQNKKSLSRKRWSKKKYFNGLLNLKE